MFELICPGCGDQPDLDYSSKVRRAATAWKGGKSHRAFDEEACSGPPACCSGAFASDYGLACFAGGGVHREDEENARAWSGSNCLGTAISATMSAPSPQCVNGSPGRSPVHTGRQDDDGQWVRHGESSPEVSACSCQPKQRAPGWHPNPAALAALAWVHPEHNELGEAHSRRTQADTPLA